MWNPITPRASRKKIALIPRNHLLVNVGPNPETSAGRSASALSTGLRWRQAAQESRVAIRSARMTKMMVRIYGISIASISAFQRTDRGILALDTLFRADRFDDQFNVP